MPVVRYDHEGNEISEAEWLRQQSESARHAAELAADLKRKEEVRKMERGEEEPEKRPRPTTKRPKPAATPSSVYMEDENGDGHDLDSLWLFGDNAVDDHTVKDIVARYLNLIRMLQAAYNAYENCPADDEREVLMDAYHHEWATRAEEWGIEPGGE